MQDRPLLPVSLLTYNIIKQANVTSPEDSEIEVKSMSPGIGTLDVFPSIWGHWAGGPPGNMDDVKWLDERLAKIFVAAPHRDEESTSIEKGMRNTSL